MLPVLDASSSQGYSSGSTRDKTLFVGLQDEMKTMGTLALLYASTQIIGLCLGMEQP
jgi:hypothetical protein